MKKYESMSFDQLMNLLKECKEIMREKYSDRDSFRKRKMEALKEWVAIGNFLEKRLRELK